MKTAIIIALITLIGAPQLVSTAPWLSGSLIDTVMQAEDPAAGEIGQDAGQFNVHSLHDHDRDPQSAYDPADHSADHSADNHGPLDCDEDCSSCTNHCSSSVVTSAAGGFPGLHLLSAPLSRGAIVTPVSLLFRPPIRA